MPERIFGMSRLIVFVCTGNICRSPMAEYLFRTHIMSQPDIEVRSSGVMAGYGAPASRYALKALEELGVDGSAHRSQPVTPDMVWNAELLVVMTAQHRDILTERHPEAVKKIVMLKSFDSSGKDEDVMDPIGLSMDVYRFVRDDIAGALWGLNLQLHETASDNEGGQI